VAFQEQRSGRPIGRALGVLLGLLSVVLLPVALVALWVSLMVTRTEVFVDEVRPLISAPGVQGALTEGAVDAVLAQLPLTPAAAKLAEPLVRDLAASVIASPEMKAVWASSMSSLHAQFVAVMEGRAAQGIDAQGRVVIAVPIALPALAKTLAPFGVAVDPALAPVVTIPVAPVEDLGRYRLAYSVLETGGMWMPVAVVGLGVLAVVLAGRRRGTALFVVAGWAIGALGLGAALVAARQPAVGQVADPTVRALANAVYGMAQRGLFIEIAVVLAVALGLGLVLRVGGTGELRRPAARPR
jgi:hypothetical protein